MISLTDSHCHLNLLDLPEDAESIAKVVQRAVDSGVHAMLNVSVSIADFPHVLNTAKHFPFVYASVGLHPNEQNEQVTIAQLIALGSDKKVVAVGETGLDYFRSTGDIEWQKQRFRDHIAAAKELRKPLIIHTRAAKEDTLHILREEGADAVGGVMHCFTEDWEMAEQALAMNFYISFSGIVTFRNATQIQEVAQRVPLDRMLIETDAPYLAPEPHRGTPNEPSYIRYTAEYLAKLRHVSLEKLAAQTTENFFTLFKGAAKPYV